MQSHELNRPGLTLGLTLLEAPSVFMETRLCLAVDLGSMARFVCGFLWVFFPDSFPFLIFTHIYIGNQGLHKSRPTSDKLISAHLESWKNEGMKTALQRVLGVGGGGGGSHAGAQTLRGS